jgi:hypothetical protein
MNIGKGTLLCGAIMVVRYRNENSKLETTRLNTSLEPTLYKSGCASLRPGGQICGTVALHP